MAKRAIDHNKHRPFHMITRALKFAPAYTLTVPELHEAIMKLATEGNEDAARFLGVDQMNPAQRDAHFAFLRTKRLDAAGKPNPDWRPDQSEKGVFYRVGTYVWDANIGYSKNIGKETPQILALKEGSRVISYVMKNPDVVDDLGRIRTPAQLWIFRHPDEALPLELQEADGAPATAKTPEELVAEAEAAEQGAVANGSPEALVDAASTGEPNEEIAALLGDDNSTEGETNTDDTTDGTQLELSEDQPPVADIPTVITEQMLGVSELPVGESTTDDMPVQIPEDAVVGVIPGDEDASETGAVDAEQGEQPSAEEQTAAIVDTNKKRNRDRKRTSRGH